MTKQSGWQASLDLKFTFEDGRTVLRDNRHVGPLVMHIDFIFSMNEWEIPDKSDLQRDLLPLVLPILYTNGSAFQSNLSPECARNAELNAKKYRATPALD